MLSLPTKEDLAKVLAIIPDPGGKRYRIGLTIGGEDYSFPLLSAEWGQSDIPVTLDATLAGVLPEDLDGADTDLWVQIGDVLAPQLFSARMAFGSGGGSGRAGGSGDEVRNTEMLASTAGSLLNGDDAVRFGDFQEYFGVPPEYVAWDILTRAPYTGNVRVEALGVPVLTYAGSASGAGITPRFTPQDKLGDGLSRLQKDADYVFRDTAVNGHVAAPPVQLGRGMPTVAEFDANDFPAWQRPTPVYPRYFDVMVYTLNPDGSYAYDPAVVEVPYRGAARKAYPGQTLAIHLDDHTADAEDNAAQLAYDTAELQARGLWSVSDIALPYFHPLIEREDGLLVAETRKDDRGETWDIRWAWKVAAYKQDYASSGSGGNTGSLSTSVATSAVILDKDRIGVPALIVPGFSGGVVRTPGPPVGNGVTGFWYDPETAIDAAGDHWIGLDATGAWIDESLSGGLAGYDGGFWFDLGYPMADDGVFPDTGVTAG